MCMFASFSILRDRFTSVAESHPLCSYQTCICSLSVRKSGINYFTENKVDTLAYLVHSTAGLLLTP